jgi:hypothetical protein
MVKACAENGTDYCDLCGEAYWIKRMIVKYADAAEQTGARIVSCCGFDSIPSDLGVHFLQQQGHQSFEELNAWLRDLKDLELRPSDAVKAKALATARQWDEAVRMAHTALREEIEAAIPSNDIAAMEAAVAAAEIKGLVPREEIFRRRAEIGKKQEDVQIFDSKELFIYKSHIFK